MMATMVVVVLWVLSVGCLGDSVRYCPEECQKYSSDGCNVCTCDRSGKILKCTRRFCYARRTSFCAQTFPAEESEDTSTTSAASTALDSTSTSGFLSKTSTNSDRRRKDPAAELQQCPANCRVYSPDGCNECFCSESGSTMWCSSMPCNSDKFSNDRSLASEGVVCKEEYLRTSTSPPPPPSTTTTTTIATTTARQIRRDNDKEPPPDLKLCPTAQCRLAMIGCRVCGCSLLDQSVEWCSPNIEGCTMTRSVCLDHSSEREVVTPNQEEEQLPNVDLRIEITNHISNGAGAKHCSGDCRQWNILDAPTSSGLDTISFTHANNVSSVLLGTTQSATPPPPTSHSQEHEEENKSFRAGLTRRKPPGSPLQQQRMHSSSSLAQALSSSLIGGGSPLPPADNDRVLEANLAETFCPLLSQRSNCDTLDFGCFTCRCDQTATADSAPHCQAADPRLSSCRQEPKCATSSLSHYPLHHRHNHHQEEEGTI